MKSVAIDFHFICDQVQNGSPHVANVSSEDQLVDALTKPFPRSQSLSEPRLAFSIEFYLEGAYREVVNNLSPLDCVICHLYFEFI
ncbi:hypothetical protein Patl1_11060 [Pistacia atlantica]|uniref:Uncharacterized protein n=1 Tax=Pistacia atlantica TaxID=434234 RepID=A0ACC1A9C2_9ROSI|nr:hypothetical protein Patl1_11060 [Pistacia atlantica]